MLKVIKPGVIFCPDPYTKKDKLVEMTKYVNMGVFVMDLQENKTVVSKGMPKQDCQEIVETVDREESAEQEEQITSLTALSLYREGAERFAQFPQRK